jgi:muramidase (phage lysozyme)
MKKILMLILLLNTCLTWCFAQDNPYLIFGYTSAVKFKDIKEDKYRVKNSNANSKIKTLEFDFENHIVNLLDKRDSIIQSIEINDDKILRFLSPDPITGKYPELTPYQFASNSPVSGVDRDGLEYYYVNDGTLIGKIGTDTRVMLISNNVTQSKAVEMMTAAHNGQNGVDQLNANSKYVGMNNAELNTRAFLSTIKNTEGGGDGSLNYNSSAGFQKNGRFNVFTNNTYTNAPEDYANHPGFVNGQTSSAAGAYQILKGSFKNFQLQDPSIKDFSPVSQDKIALLILNYRKAIPDAEAGNLSELARKLTIRKGGEQFASLPGGSQQTVTMDQLRVLFKKNLSKELNNKSNIATPVGTLSTYIIHPRQ